MTKTWFITGASTGFGRELAVAALARGDRVAVTLRQPSQIAEFEALAPGRAKACLADVTDASAVERAVAAVIDWASGIDIVVNNAGYGLIGAFEEISDGEFQQVMATNFFGAVAVLRAVIPHLRARRSGSIVNISSAAGIRGIPGFSAYSASKFAMSGLSEALHGELAPFGIRVMVVEPGAFRTSFRDGTRVAERIIDDYRDTPGGWPRAARAENRIGQRGDPVKLVRNLLQVIDSPEWPRHFPVGDETIEMIEKLQTARNAELERWRPLGTNVSLDPEDRD